MVYKVTSYTSEVQGLQTMQIQAFI